MSCIGTNTNCTECNSTGVTPALEITNGLGSCLSVCPLSFYLSTSISPSQCVLCDNTTYFCATCLSVSVCQSCLANFYFYNSNCIPSCPASITIQNSGTWTCDLCSVECATCSGTTTNCDTCASGSARYNGQCVTSCPSPLVISNQTCVSCDSSCKTCFGDTTNCTACNITSSLPFLTVTSAFLGSCVSSCPPLYYGSLVNGICDLCANLNIGCTDCSSQTTCNSCTVSQGFIFYQNTCITYIPTTFYNNSGVATACDANCATCSGSATFCTSCTGALSLSGNLCVTDSNCPAGTVAQNNLCTACDSAVFCKTCAVTTTNCTSCLTNIPAVYLLNGACGQTCPNYTFPNASSLACEPCTTASNC